MIRRRDNASTFAAASILAAAVLLEVPHTGTYVLEIYSGVELVWRQEVLV